MEPFVVIAVVVVVAGVAWYFLKGDGNVTKEEIMEAVENATDIVEDVVEEVTEAVEEVVEKVEEALVSKPKLPATKELEAMKKADLEAFARDHGVELDKRMTKANMIKDFRAQYKKV